MRKPLLWSGIGEIPSYMDKYIGLTRLSTILVDEQRATVGVILWEGHINMRSVSAEVIRIYSVPKSLSNMVKSSCKQWDEEYQQGLIDCIFLPFRFQRQDCCSANISDIVVCDVNKKNMSAEWQSYIFRGEVIKVFASFRLCVSSLHRDHANLLCIFKRLNNASPPKGGAILSTNMLIFKNKY